MIKKEKLPKIEDTILLTGETGVGKTSLAKWIHKSSSKANYQFIQLNVASLSEELFESELFGHKKGSFTGANGDKIGFCEKVGRGVLFLDEIGELSLKLQKKLLTLVDEKIYYPVGSTEKKIFRGQIIFATHRNLNEMVMKGSFREDLYFRICTFSYNIKPLRDEKKIKEIVYSTIKDEQFKQNKFVELTRGVKNFFENYHFPGNYRELNQIVKYLIFSAEREALTSDLPLWITSQNIEKPSSDDYYDALEIFEKRFLVDKLKKYQGMINKTASKINISKVTLISKIKKYDINVIKLKMEALNGI